MKPETVKFLFTSGKHSDLKITVGNDLLHTFNVHRVIVCSQSEVFERIIDRKTSKSGSKEIKLSQHSSSTFERVLSYLYTGDYDEKGHLLDMPETEDDESVGESNLYVYLNAVEFGLNGLKDMAANRFRFWMEQNLAEVDFAVAVEQVMDYDTRAYEELRADVVSFAAHKIRAFLKCPDMENVLERNPKLAIHLLKKLAEKKTVCSDKTARVKRDRMDYDDGV